LCLAGLSLSVAHPVAADVYTLEQALDYTLAHNLDLAAAQEQTHTAAARTAIAQGGQRPQVDLRYLLRRSDNPLDAFADKLNTRSVNSATDFTNHALNQPDPSTLSATELAVRMPVYTGGRLHAALRAAEDGEQASRLQAERTREVAVFRTRLAYLAAQAAAEAVTIANDAVEAARGHAQTTARLVREGRIVVSDKLTAELNLAAAESAREQALNRQRRSLDELKLVMGMPLDDALETQAWQSEPIIPVLTPPSESEQRALAQRKDLQATQSRASAGRAHVDEARAAFKPQVSVVAASSWYDDGVSLDNRSTSIMGVVSLNLYNGGLARNEVAAARSQAMENDIQLRNQERVIRNEVRSAHNDLTEALARYRIAAQNADKARETVRLVRQRYGEGRTILIDVLMSERVLVETRNEQLASAYNIAVSQAALRLAEGAPDHP
jgi:outer membrane protein TolC